jgi:23S rRNA pseudouridine1911/1915/1917 synthase
MAYIKHPVINDPLYNKDKVTSDYGQMLHAYYLGFNHPITGKFIEFTAPLENKFIEIQNKFKNS